MLKTVLVVREKSGDSYLGSTYSDIAFMHKEMREYSEALQMHQKALPLLEKEHGIGHTIVARTRLAIDECSVSLE